MVDEGRAARLLRGVSERVSRLEAAAAKPDESIGSLWLDGVKYLFVTSIEGCVDLAHHVCSSESWRAPDTNADAIRMLGEHGVLSVETARRVAQAVGFRNVLVHQYAEVDDRIVIKALDNLADLRAFVSESSGWILRQAKTGDIHDG